MRHRIKQLDRGLHLSTPLELTPPGYLRRAKSIGPLSTASVKSRDGSALIFAQTCHSASYFIDHWVSGYSTSIAIGNGWINSAQDGSRLSMTPMPPTAGIKDQLFICGGAELVKIDSGDTSIVESSVYQWDASGSGTNEYYLQIVGGGNPNIAKFGNPRYILEDSTAMTYGTIGTLTAGEWVWGDNDALGYDTIYVRLTDNVDPDGKASAYLQAGYVSDWGIEPPSVGPALADGGASGQLDDGGAYKYRLTYYNSKTGTRSNPSPTADVYSLLAHLDGADSGTTFTESGNFLAINGNATAVGNAHTDTTVKKFGTASLQCDGTGDCIYWADQTFLSPDSEKFSIDWWSRFDDVTTGDIHSQFSKYDDANNYFMVRIVTGGADAVEVYYRNNSVLEIGHYIAGITIAVDTFYHFALIRGWGGDENKMAFTQDGTALLTWDYSGSISNDGSFIIGADQAAGSNSHKGYIDEFRFLKGATIATETFAVPTVASSLPSITLTAGQTKCALSDIPQSNDTQVDSIEIWRTAGSGSAYFRTAVLPDGTTTYTDNVSDDDQESTELPTDNIKPYSWFEDALYHNASAFWITRTQDGQKGRVYYSPIGRCESVAGFINVTNDDDPLQKLVYWAGMLLVFSTSGIFQILGENPYKPRRIAGIPGTTAPHTVTATPLGIIYESASGIRVFRGGTKSDPLYYDAIKPIFRGLSAGALTSFTGVVATYARNEYLISDNTQSLAVDLTNGRWRNLGVGANCLAYSEESNQIAFGKTSQLLDWEKEGENDDNGTDIAFEIEVPAPLNEAEVDLVCQRVVVDADTGNESLTATLVYDSSTVSLGTVQHNGRLQTELPAGKIGSVFSLRLAGNLNASAQCVEVYEVAFDIYNPTKGE